MAAHVAEIPGPPPLPLLGNLLQIPKTRLVQYLLATSREYRGIYRLRFPHATVLFVYSPELVAEVCDESRFRKVIRPPLLFLRDIAGDGLFTAHADEPNWGKAHRVLLPAFGQRAMRGYFDDMLLVAQQLVQSWTARQGQDILVAADMTRLTLDTISLTGFDYRFNSFESEKLHPFLEAMGRVLTEAMLKSTRLPIQNRWRRQRRYLADIALMNQLVDDVIRRRRAQPVDSRDLLNLMLNAVDPQTQEKLDDINIRYQVITFLIAGHETTSGLLTFALYLLLRHPHVLAQAYAEVDRVLPGDTTPAYAHLAELDVIERVLKEALRLWPTAPAFTVAPYQDTLIGGHYRVKRDQSVAVVIPALHRDPQVWPDPDTFNIDRFLPDAEAKIPRHAYKPFGNGQRACIGRQFALTEAKLALAVILRHFALSDPYDYRLDIKETLTLKPDNFYLRVRRRAPHERLVVAAEATSAPIAHEIAPAVRAEGKAFTVLYGTSLGTSREVAEQIEERARHLGFTTKIAPMDEYTENLPETGVLIVVTATYNGEAPDSARETARQIAQGAFAAMKRPQLQYAVLGCGNSQWPNYQEFPKIVDQALRQTGAAALLPRGEADGNAQFDIAVEQWSERLWIALGDSGATAAAEPPRIVVAYASATDALSGVLAPSARALQVTGNSELVRDPAGLWDFTLEPPRASTRHITLQLPQGVEYRTGDHLAIYPRNRPDLVNAIAARLENDPQSVVVLESDPTRIKHLPIGKPVTVARLLGDFVELQDPATRADVRRLIAHTASARAREQLERLIAEDDAAAERFAKEITDKRVSVYDLLLRFPAIRLPLAAYLETCSAIRPRLYSISSSALATPREVSLTVGAVGTWYEPSEHQGVASAYLRRLAPGDRIMAAMRRPEPPFAPGDDPRLPMILIGPGTGFAPFRGFLHERAVQREQGREVAPSLVFYGCRHPQHDWFYESEMLAFESQGIAKLHLAFSSVPSHPHRFVQDALWAERANVWKAYQRGATIYVCGDGRFMAPAIRDTLIRIHEERSGSTRDAASAWLQAAIKSGRYRQDVFGDV